LNFRKANIQLFKQLVKRTPGKLPSGTREQNRAGRRKEREDLKSA